MFEHQNLPNLGITISTLPAEIYRPVLAEIKDIQRDDSEIVKMNKTLAGHVAKEYQLTKSRSFLDPFLIKMGEEYCSQWGGVISDKSADESKRRKSDNPKLKIDSIWVNCQSKYEYNPLHNHGGLLSFVCWMEIPYKIGDEQNTDHSKHSRDWEQSSTFQFVYTNILGKVVNIPFFVERGWEGRIVMFPSDLLHVVYPFYTSNDYRISIAGNIL